MEFPVRKNCYSATVHSWVWMDSPAGVYRTTDTILCISKCSGGSLSWFWKTPWCPHTSWEVLQAVIRWQSSSQSPTSQCLPLHDFSISKGNKTTHSPTTIWQIQTSKHEILAYMELAATKTNILLSLLLFKGKARMVIQKHKNTDTLTLWKTRIGASMFPQGCLPTFISEWCLATKLCGRVAREMLRALWHLLPWTHTAKVGLCHTGTERYLQGCQSRPMKEMWPDNQEPCVFFLVPKM